MVVKNTIMVPFQQHTVVKEWNTTSIPTKQSPSVPIPPPYITAYGPEILKGFVSNLSDRFGLKKKVCRLLSRDRLDHQSEIVLDLVWF
jgi:hypothetical protein